MYEGFIVQNSMYLTGIVKNFLPYTAEIIIFDKPYKTPAVMMADLDGDMFPEIIGGYRYNGENYIIILKNYCNIWHLAAIIKGKGYNISYLIAAPISGRGINNLIIGWQIGAIWSKLNIFEWTGEGFKNIAPKDMHFSKIEVEDMPGEKGKDGRYEMALWVHDTGEAYKIEIYRWNNNRLIPAEDVYSYYFKKVIKYYERLIKEMPDSPIYWYYLADAQAKAGMKDEALKSIDKALKLPYQYPSKEELIKFKKGLMSGSLRQMMYYNGYSGYILDFKQGDVSGDRIIDYVYLVGDRPFGMESPFAENITLVILDGKTNSYSRIPFKVNTGYNPTVFLGDFTGDKVNDILVNIESGGSGGYIFSYVYSLLNNNPRELFDFEKFNEEYKYDVVYKNDYKVDVINENLNKKYTLDIEYKDPEYLFEIYDENGKLKEPLMGEVTALSGLYPIDIERDGTYELNAIQRIIGRFNADILGFVDTSLKWDGMKFIPSRQYVSIPG